MKSGENHRFATCGFIFCVCKASFLETFKRQFLGVRTIKGRNGNRNENCDLGGKLTCLHEIFGNCSAGREAFRV